MGNPAGLVKAQDLESDRPGRASDNRMRARHVYSTQESIRDRTLRNFYREVIDRLERGLYDHEYEYITLMAEPRLLGIIRELLPPGVRNRVSREIPKDLSYEAEGQILARLEGR
jgi:protein required for attachment to host cells